MHKVAVRRLSLNSCRLTDPDCPPVCIYLTAPPLIPFSLTAQSSTPANQPPATAQATRPRLGFPVVSLGQKRSFNSRCYWTGLRTYSTLTSAQPYLPVLPQPAHPLAPARHWTLYVFFPWVISFFAFALACRGCLRLSMRGAAVCPWYEVQYDVRCIRVGGCRVADLGIRFDSTWSLPRVVRMCM